MTTVAARVLAWGAGALPGVPARVRYIVIGRPLVPSQLGRTGGIGLALWDRTLVVSATPCHARAEGRHHMQDALYLGLILGFLALSWGLVELCDRL
jgi:hypothetical protein